MGEFTLKPKARQTNTVSKFDTKRSIKNLFEKAGVVQTDIANDIHINEATLSRELNPADELDGFVYHYLRVMGWLSINAPSVFISIDTLVQTHLQGWRESDGLVVFNSDDEKAIDLNYIASEAVSALVDKRKSVAEKRARVTELAGMVAMIQQSFNGEETANGNNRRAVETV